MKKPAKLYRNGKYIRDVDDAEKYVVQPNEMLHFSLSLMDADPLQRAVLQDAATPPAPLHAPGYVHVADSDYDRRADMYDAQKTRLSSAWRDVPPLAATPHADAAPGIVHARPRTGDAADLAWENRNAALERAYLGA